MGGFGPPDPSKGFMLPQKLSRPVSVSVRDGGELQMLLKHPVTGGNATFTVSRGWGTTSDPDILRCLLDHPLRDQANVAGGFLLIGNDNELEALYAEAKNQPAKVNELQLAKEQIVALEKELKEVKAKKADKVPA